MTYIFRVLLIVVCFASIKPSKSQTVDCSTAATWISTSVYNAGNQVKYNGSLYTAKWWTQGNQPDLNYGAGGDKQWTLNGICSSSSKGTRTATITSASSGMVGATIPLTYTAVPSINTGAWVVTNGTGAASISGNNLSLTAAGVVTLTLTIGETTDFYATTATQTITITNNAVVLDCSEIGLWDASVAYSGGNQVKYNSSLYQAKYWTQGNQPDINYGTAGDRQWTLIGVCTDGGTEMNMPWRINGNSNTNSNSYLGTLTNTALKFKANNIEHMRLQPSGTLQIGGMIADADSYFKLDVTGRVALRSDPGVNQNNILLLYSNHQTTPSYLAGFRHYTGFSHVLLGATEVGVINTVDYNAATQVAIGKHLLIQNTPEGNLGIGNFSSAPPQKLSVNGNALFLGSTQIGSQRVLSGHADYKLSVDGKITCQKIIATPNSWADTVFSEGYKAMELKEIENFIIENKRLPEIPSEAEVKSNGVDLAEMNRLLLKKMEEMTLYIIELNKRVKELEEGK
jgi:chitodextrinase